jgi:hypothetical protein
VETKKAATPKNIAARVTERLFDARKGHGGAAVSYLQMRPGDLHEAIEAAIQLMLIRLTHTGTRC